MQLLTVLLYREGGSQVVQQAMSNHFSASPENFFFAKLSDMLYVPSIVARQLLLRQLLQCQLQVACTQRCNAIAHLLCALRLIVLLCHAGLESWAGSTRAKRSPRSGERMPRWQQQ